VGGSLGSEQTVTEVGTSQVLAVGPGGNMEGVVAETAVSSTVDALTVLTEALEVMARDSQVLIQRVDQLRDGRNEGLSWRELLASETPDNGTLELLSEVLRQLTEASAQLRKSVVQELLNEGVSVPTVAGLLGISHQRGSYILRSRAESIREKSRPAAVQS
jgi:hypothetical protein